MTNISLEIPDDLVDGFTIGRMAKAFNNGSFDVFLCHRIGSVKDNFGRSLGKFTSGKGCAATVEEALLRAQAALSANVAANLAEQNSRLPSTSTKGIDFDEVELFKLLDL